MILSAMPIYSSSNGDRWRLLIDANTGDFMVRHDANEASGGTVTYQEAADFLAAEGPGPEYAALRALLKQLAETQPLPPSLHLTAPSQQENAERPG